MPVPARSAGRERLVNAAMRLFGQRGFEAVGTKELAVAAGLTIGALYHHFPSKEAIYREALERALARLPAAPLAQVRAAPPREQLILQTAWFAETLVREPLLRQELLEPHLDRPLTELAHFAESMAHFRAAMPAGAPGVDPEMAITAIVALSFGMTTLKGIGNSFRPPEDPAQLARLITSLVF